MNALGAIDAGLTETIEGGMRELELTIILAVAVSVSPVLFCVVRRTLYEPGVNCTSNAGKLLAIEDELEAGRLF
jgi:hypothetical protein